MYSVYIYIHVCLAEICSCSLLQVDPWIRRSQALVDPIKSWKPHEISSSGRRSMLIF